MAKLQVELVSPERELWSGSADMVVAKTLEGSIGVMPGHVPVLGVLEPGGVVAVHTGDGTVSAAVHGGFISVADDKISILAEVAEMSDEIDVARAEQALERAQSGDTADEEVRAEIARARARLRAAGRES
ncbi:F0F1 ATP synthase subunit epsilon [Allonocardiopsis opalescens]|uniref:ATP synthase epsilon chain n=1 Tax=Allonocardiopsis opalescens TaxID=1144618 RepID=A0A2T0QD62_9ACTN|nr:F0F1 ATP synthase subunit epsilon [Allonocardiopsis opalescens]PRY01793.1 F-type H+-transporting ATPase subunit epsilon [Allonocardiopsis opalescens]